MAPELLTDDPGDRIAREVVVRGRVQGVFFRATVRDAARRAGVDGWARNLPDGTLAIRLEGERSAVASVEEACGRGPRGARVESVEGRDVAVEGLGGFSVG